MAKPKTSKVVPTLAPVAEKVFVVDEIHVQVIMREEANGETVAKHAAEPFVFLNERVFREWASRPFTLSDARNEGAKK